MLIKKERQTTGDLHQSISQRMATDKICCNTPIVVVVPKPRNSIFITQNGYEFYAIAKTEGWNLQVFTEAQTVTQKDDFNCNILA